MVSGTAPCLNHDAGTRRSRGVFLSNSAHAHKKAFTGTRRSRGVFLSNSTQAHKKSLHWNSSLPGRFSVKQHPCPQKKPPLELAAPGVFFCQTAPKPTKNHHHPNTASINTPAISSLGEGWQKNAPGGTSSSTSTPPVHSFQQPKMPKPKINAFCA